MFTLTDTAETMDFNEVASENYAEARRSAAACSRVRAWRSSVDWFVEYQPECSNHGGRPIIALPCHTMTEAIDHCIRWREEGATGTFKVTTRRKEVEEIILCENAQGMAREALPSPSCSISKSKMHE